MKFLVIAPAFWNTEHLAGMKCWLYLASLKKAGVREEQHTFYGVGATQYPGSATMRVYAQIPFLRSLPHDITHVIFSDAWDVLFVQPIDIIIDQYIELGSPPWLMGATRWGFLDLHPPELEQHMALPYFDSSSYCPYPSTTFWIGEPSFIAGELDRVEKGAHNESYPVAHAFRDGLLHPVLDTGCRIFQEKGMKMDVVDGKIHNRETNTFPGIVHFSDGYTDPVHGKDPSIIPWAKDLGII